MSAAAALILLAEAATACAPPAPPRLRAGAIIIRPVATADAPPFALLGPAAPLTTEPKIHKTAASDSATGRDAPPVEQCKAPLIHMV